MLAVAACSGNAADTGNGSVDTSALAQIEPAAATEGSPCPARLRAAIGDAEGLAGIAVRLVDPSGTDDVELDRLPADARGSGSHDGQCVLLVGPPRLVAAELHTVASGPIEAERVLSVRRRPNPRYRELERELDAARAAPDRSTPEIVRTGEPTVDLVGLIAGTLLEAVDLFAGEDARVAALEAELARTPPMLEEEMTTHLVLAAERIEVEKRGEIDVALVDTVRSHAWSAGLPLREHRLYLVLPADAPGDLRVPEQPDAVLARQRDSVRDWADRPPRARLSALLTQFEPVLAGPGQPQTVAGLVGLWRERPRSAGHGDLAALDALEPAASPPSRSPSVVVVGADGAARALGFYVGREHVLTLASALPRTVLVPVEVAPGFVTYGLAESVDRDLGLALVWLPKPGTPLGLASAGELAGVPHLLQPLSEVPPLPGAPLVAADRVVAVLATGDSSGVRVDARQIARFLAEAGARAGIDIGKL